MLEFYSTLVPGLFIFSLVDLPLLLLYFHSLKTLQLLPQNLELEERSHSFNEDFWF